MAWACIEIQPGFIVLTTTISYKSRSNFDFQDVSIAKRKCFMHLSTISMDKGSCQSDTSIELRSFLYLRMRVDMRNLCRHKLLRFVTIITCK